jgi:hypothetical protein
MSKTGGGVASNKWIIPVTLVLLVSLVLALLSFFRYERWDDLNARYILETAEQQILSQRMARYGFGAVLGEKSALTLLKEARNKFETSTRLLRSGSPDQDLPSSPPEVEQELKAVEGAWAELRDGVDHILASTGLAP